MWFQKKVVTRFAPSPTGPFHIGNVRTALFNFLFSRQNRGKFILRIEDTDKLRSEKKYEEEILNGLKWLGLNWDELYRQSERIAVYRKYLQKLLDGNKAYLDGEAIRFRNLNKKVKFNDLIRGEIEFDTTELGDFVIAKNIEEPLYHLAVVIDDFEMGVTHVIRGEDHVSNTPRQILIQEAIRAPRPIYAHLPLILAPDRSKLSKRSHGEAVSAGYYREAGYLPEAVINFLALLGWNSGTDEEIFSLDELIKKFDIKKVQKSGAIFNTEKLDWLNKQYIKKMTTKELGEALLKFLPSKPDNWEKIVELEKERIAKLSDIKEGTEYFFDEPKYGAELLVWKKSDKNKTKIYLEELLKKLCDMGDREWSKEKIKDVVWPYAEKNGRGDVLWPLRMALTGLERSPEPFTLADILGKIKTINRIKNAIAKLC
jgi:glutamyl-tRNA synthetase